jgi:hypothetical protein
VPALNFIVFNYPTTGGHSATYPYGLISEAAPFQEFLYLARKFLLDDYFFAFQSLAWHNRSVLVLPILPDRRWDLFASGEGLLRLLREIALFLHRQGRTSVLGLRTPDGRVATELAGPNLRRLTPPNPFFSTDFGPIPRVGRVAVSAFSKGIEVLKGAMGGRQFQSGLSSRLWGVPPTRGVDPQREWASVFREVWDLDGDHRNTGGWPAYLDLLRTWFNHDSDRVVRSYHTEETAQRHQQAEPHPVWKELRGKGLDLDRPAKQATDGTWATLQLPAARHPDRRRAAHLYRLGRPRDGRPADGVRHALREYERHYNKHRTHRSLAASAPLRARPQPLEPAQIERLTVDRQDRLGGVIHEYHHAA